MEFSGPFPPYYGGGGLRELQNGVGVLESGCITDIGSLSVSEIKRGTGMFEL